MKQERRYQSGFSLADAGLIFVGGDRVDENMESLSEIRRLTPEVVHMMDEMLHSNKIPAMVKVRIMEIVLERTFGKPEAAIRLSTAQQNVEAAQERISAIVSQIRIGGGDPSTSSG